MRDGLDHHVVLHEGDVGFRLRGSLSDFCGGVGEARLTQRVYSVAGHRNYRDPLTDGDRGEVAGDHTGALLRHGRSAIGHDGVLHLDAGLVDLTRGQSLELRRLDELGARGQHFRLAASGFHLLRQFGDGALELLRERLHFGANLVVNLALFSELAFELLDGGVDGLAVRFERLLQFLFHIHCITSR